MRSIVNLFFLLLFCRLVATTSLFENGISAKTHNLEKNNVIDPRLPNSAHNSFRGSDNRRYHPSDPNYQSPPDYNFVNYYNNLRPPNLPHFPQVPISHHAQYPRPPPYNILKSYNSTPLIRPINPYLPNDKQKHVLNEVKSVHPTENIKFEEKLHGSVVKHQINETIPIENTTEEIDLHKNKFVDKVSAIEDDTSDILDKPIILTNDTNITLINSEEERLFDEAQLLLETNKESNNNTNSSIEAFHNETSNQFKKTKDILVNLLPTENSTEIVKNNDLLTDKESNVTTPLLKNGLHTKIYGLQNFNLNNDRLPKSALNSFHIPDNRRYHPNNPNYQSALNYNFPNYYKSYRPTNLPNFPQVPKSYHAQLPKSLPYTYNGAPLIKPMKYLPTDKQIHVLNEVKPVHPTGNIKFEEKLHERVFELPSDVRNIISRPLIRNHYASNQKKYMIIYPNGTVDDVDYVEPAVTEHSNYVFVNGADIIPIKNGSPVQIFEHESYTSSDLKNVPVLQLDDLVNQEASPKPKVQVIVEEPVENKYQNHNITVISSSKVSDSNSQINNVPTTIIEINPQFTTSSDNNVTKTQSEEVINTRLFAKKDIIKNENLFEGQINETKPTDNATEEIDPQKNTSIGKVPAIEVHTSDILDKSIILTNETNNTLLNSDQEHLFDEEQLLLETNKESNNNTNSFIETFHNETSNQFKETKDFLVNLLPTENSTAIVNNYDLLTDKVLSDANSTTTIAGSDTSNNTGDNYGNKLSGVNISSTPPVDDISTASVTTPPLKNGLHTKIYGLQNFNLNNDRLPKSALNSFHIPDNRRYHHNDPNYLSPPNYNFPDYYNNYRPPNLPYFPQVPLSYLAQYPRPLPYTYNSAPLIRPTKYLPTDKQRHVLNEDKPVYPTGNIKFEEKLHETLVKPPSDVRNIILQPTIRNHYASNQKKYMIIYPNGTVDDVDNLEPDVTEHQNYVLVNGSDVIPFKNAGPVQTFDHKTYTSNEYEAPTLKIQLNEEGPLDNRFQNNHDFVVDSPSKVYNTQTGTLINNTPTTIIEMDPQFIISSDNNVTKTQQEGAVNTTSSVDGGIIRSEDLIEESSKETISPDLLTKFLDELPSFESEPEAKISFDPFIDFEDDISYDSFDQIRKHVAKALEENVSSHDIETIARLADDFGDLFITTQINETKVNENATDEIYLDNIKLINKIPTIGDDMGDILDKSTILSKNTNITSLNSEQERLFDDVHLPLETNNESTFHDNAGSPSIESLYNETSNQFSETKDLPVNLLSTESPTEIVKNYNLPADKERDGPKSSTPVAWSDTSNNTEDNYGNESSGFNTFPTPTVGDISVATDDVTPTATKERSVYFKIDKDFWDKLKHKEIPFDVVYFFELQEPVVKKGIKAITYPNGTVVTYETLHDVEDNRPILIKNIDKY